MDQFISEVKDEGLLVAAVEGETAVAEERKPADRPFEQREVALEPRTTQPGSGSAPVGVKPISSPEPDAAAALPPGPGAAVAVGGRTTSAGHQPVPPNVAGTTPRTITRERNKSRRSKVRPKCSEARSPESRRALRSSTEPLEVHLHRFAG